MKLIVRCLSLAALLTLVTVPAAGAKQPKKTSVYPVAILAFSERGPDVKDLGPQITDLMFANLASNPTMYLVDREDLDKLLKEQELNLSGAVNPAEATQVGQLTGAKIIITGSVLQVGNKLYLIAKIIGTETSRVVGASVNGRVQDDLDELVQQLAGQVAKTSGERADDLIAQPKSRDDRIAALRQEIGRAKSPVVRIEIDERHVGQATIDPAAETEFTLYCTELGFDVIDPDVAGRGKPEIVIKGEGISEYCTRHGNLVSVMARLEVKATDTTTGRVVAIDRQVSVEVDVTEQIAGKAALQEAAACIAERMLPKLVTPVPEKKRRKGR